MTIAYDLRYACDHFPGIGTHAFVLLESLLELEGDEHYVVLWDPRSRNTRFDLERIQRHPRVSWTQRPFSPLGLLSLIRTGRWLRGSGAAVYLSPFHLLPPGAGCPCVVTVHDVRPLRQAGGLSSWRRMLSYLSLRGVARAHTIIAISDFSRIEIQQALGLPDGRVRTVRHGIRARRAAPNEQRPAGVPEGEFALAVGDNRPHKNLPLLAQAWARIETHSPLQLVAAGPEDPRYPTLGELASRTGAKRAQSLGWVSGAELGWLYRHAVLLVLPSLYEGFGATMVEAFAYGLPVLAADIPALREIGQGIPRFLDPSRADLWSEEILRLVASREELNRMGRAGLECEGLPTYHDTARATLDLLREAARGD